MPPVRASALPQERPPRFISPVLLTAVALVCIPLAYVCLLGWNRWGHSSTTLTRALVLLYTGGALPFVGMGASIAVIHQGLIRHSRGTIAAGIVTLLLTTGAAVLAVVILVYVWALMHGA